MTILESTKRSIVGRWVSYRRITFLRRYTNHPLKISLYLPTLHLGEAMALTDKMKPHVLEQPLVCRELHGRGQGADQRVCRVFSSKISVWYLIRAWLRDSSLLNSVSWCSGWDLFEDLREDHMRTGMRFCSSIRRKLQVVPYSTRRVPQWTHGSRDRMKSWKI